MPLHSSPEHFDWLSDLGEWTPGPDPIRSQEGRAILLQCETDHPALLSPSTDLPLSQIEVLYLSMTGFSAAGQSNGTAAMASLYYATDHHPDFSEDRVVHFRVFPDGLLRDYVILIHPKGEPGERLHRVRFDPLHCPGKCRVEAFFLSPLAALPYAGAPKNPSKRLANELSVQHQVASGSSICMGYPEPVIVIDHGPREIQLPEASSLFIGIVENLADEMLEWIPRITLSGQGSSLNQMVDSLDLVAEKLYNAGCSLRLDLTGQTLDDPVLSRLAQVLDPSEDMPDPKTTQTAHNVAWCCLPWTQALIDLNGMIHPCLPLWDAPIGHLMETRFFDSWNGEAFRALRSSLGSPSMSSICRDCVTRKSSPLGR